MKKLISLILSLSLALSLSVSALAATGSSFSDVPMSHWAYQYVERAADEGWVAGVGGGKFNPDGQVTGAQWYTMVARAFYGDQIPDKADSGKWYSDKWYGPYMQVGVDNMFDAYFAADIDASVAERPMTRTEMACVVTEVMDQMGVEVPQDTFYAVADTIPDLDKIPVTSSAYTAVVRCYAMGIIGGVDKAGTFNGDGLMNRAQAAVVLGRMADLVDNGGKIPDAPEQPTEPTKPTEPEQPSEPTEPTKPATPSDVPTEQEVYNAIIALKAQYPDGTPWGDDKLYQIWSPISTGELYPINCRGCAAFVQMCQDAAFGDGGTGKFAKVTHYDSFDSIRVGDNVGYDTDYGTAHAVVVLEKKPNSIIVAEGNNAGKVLWGREITRDFLESHNVRLSTRYPA